MRAWLSGNRKKPWPGSEGPSGNQAPPPGLALVSCIFPHQLLVTTFPADQLRLFSSSSDRETELSDKKGRIKVTKLENERRRIQQPNGLRIRAGLIHRFGLTPPPTRG